MPKARLVPSRAWTLLTLLLGLVTPLSGQVGGQYGQDGPGYTFGAGYDFHFARALALTPYVSVFGGSISKLEYFDGSTNFETAGRAIAVHGGLLLTFRPRPEDL